MARLAAKEGAYVVGRIVAVVALVVAIAGCSGDSGGTTTIAVTTSGTATTAAAASTSSPATTAAGTSAPTSDTTMAMRPESAWFGYFSDGACFDDVLADGEFDFAAAPALVDCAQPHGNEVMAIAVLGEDAAPFPGVDAVADQAVAACDATASAFVGGRDIRDTDLVGWYVWPDAIDWEQGVRTAVCAVYGSDLMIGTARSASLTAEGTVMAVVAEMDGVVDVWLADPITGDLLVNVTDDAAQELLNPVAWSPDGRVIAYGADDVIYAIDATGSGVPEPLVEGPGSASSPDYSPDGASILFVSDRAGTGDLDIFRLDLTNGEITQLTDAPDRESSPEYSPDGSKIVFRGRVDGNSDIYVMDADGSNITRVTDDPGFDGDPEWTPDGRAIVFISDRTGDYDIHMVSVDGDGLVNLTNHPGNDEYPAVTPDGTRIAFHSDRLGGTNVWIMNMDGTSQSLLTPRGPVGYVAFAPGTG